MEEVEGGREEGVARRYEYKLGVETKETAELLPVAAAAEKKPKGCFGFF